MERGEITSTGCEEKARKFYDFVLFAYRSIQVHLVSTWPSSHGASICEGLKTLEAKRWCRLHALNTCPQKKQQFSVRRARTGAPSYGQGCMCIAENIFYLFFLFIIKIYYIPARFTHDPKLVSLSGSGRAFPTFQSNGSFYCVIKSAGCASAKRSAVCAQSMDRWLNAWTEFNWSFTKGSKLYRKQKRSAQRKGGEI